MRLYLDAKSKNGIGYMPDWLRVTYKSNGKTYEFTLDIRGEIDYDPNGLVCRCKGELVPWVHYCCDTGKEQIIDYLTSEELDIFYPPVVIMNYIDIATEFEIGIYPVDDSDDKAELIESDVISNGEAKLEMYIDEDTYFTKEFKFTTELNY